MEEILERSGGGITDQLYLDDIILGKKFFSDAGLLPGTKYYENAVNAAPTPDWDRTGVTPVAVGNNKRWAGVPTTSLFGWDLGGNKQRILFIASGYQCANADRLMGMSTTIPAGAGDATGNGYLTGNNNIGTWAMYKMTGGGYSNLSPTSYWVAYTNYPISQAMLFDNGNIRAFAKMGNSNWMEVAFKNDGTYTSLRYVWIRLLGAGDMNLGPVSIYYDN